MEVNTFKEQLASSPLLESVNGVVAWTLPIGEIILAIILFIPPSRLKGLYISGVLMALFTAYVGIILLMDNHLSCSCGGIIEDLSPKQHLLFNSACIILSIVGILVERRKQPTIRFKWITTTGTFFLFLLVGWTLFTAFSTPSTIKTGMEGRHLPSFDILLPDSTTLLNTEDIPTGKPIIFIGFSPTCTHCQAETRDVISHIDQLKNTQIYFVTPFPFKDMKMYYRYFKLANYPNIKIGTDLKDKFLTYFKASGVPYTVIFDSKKRVKQVISSRFDITKLTKAANE
jgi:thiol-disulfide isomerase/thioredoxin